jgi:hypothetical protein
MDKSDLGKALHAYNVGLPYIRSSYFDCIHTIELHVALLAHHVPYSIQSEIDVNAKVMNYVNLCVRHMNVFRKYRLTEKLEFPIEHNLLRFFRDFNHHNADCVFRPIRVSSADRTTTIDFFIYPILYTIPAIKARYPEWCRRGNPAVLSDLLERNQRYVEKVFDQARDKMGGDSVAAKYNGEYYFGEAFFGKDALGVEESWLLAA